jgi:hypothetical protein
MSRLVQSSLRAGDPNVGAIILGFPGTLPREDSAGGWLLVLQSCLHP